MCSFDVYKSIYPTKGHLLLFIIHLKGGIDLFGLNSFHGILVTRDSRARTVLRFSQLLIVIALLYLVTGDDSVV